MILSFALALLAHSLTPPELVQSDFVDDTHQPDWADLEVEPEGVVAVDLAYIDTVEVDGVEYPVALMRLTDRNAKGDPSVFDLLQAVDCEGLRMGLVELWTMRPTDGLPARIEAPKVEWDTVRDLPAPGRRVLFGAKCGPDWVDPVG